MVDKLKSAFAWVKMFLTVKPMEFKGFVGLQGLADLAPQKLAGGGGDEVPTIYKKVGESFGVGVFIEAIDPFHALGFDLVWPQMLGYIGELPVEDGKIFGAQESKVEAQVFNDDLMAYIWAYLGDNEQPWMGNATVAQFRFNANAVGSGVISIANEKRILRVDNGLRLLPISHEDCLFQIDEDGGVVEPPEPPAESRAILRIVVME